jgi:DNA-directed RNA polymerase specialized sigma24 family protein
MGTMDESSGGTGRKKAAEDLILRTIAAHAESLLRTARRHSICVDDAQDAYQRAIELFMGHAQRLDAARAAGWLHVVVKREAQAIARARRKILCSTEVDLDGREAPTVPTPEEQLLSFDLVSRSAEALKRLRPHEIRALWLRAQGHSYSDISAITGWSYTKVNRCVSEGRRHFLEQYEGIESGEECKRWLPVLSAMVDGEASPEDVLEVRPHLRNCPGCRATLRALQDSTTPLAALMPVPLVVVESGYGDQVVQFAMRVYETVATSVHERAVNSLTKAHAVLEASAAGKVTAVAASAAAVAGGGYASVDELTGRSAPSPVTKIRASFSAAAPERAWTTPTARIGVAKARPTPNALAPASQGKRSEFTPARARGATTSAPEFQPQKQATATRARSAFAARSAAGSGPPRRVQEAKPAAPEFMPRASAPEFGP